MIQAAAFTLGMLAMFVFSSARNNLRMGREHSPVLRNVGMGVVGSLAAVAIVLIASIPLGIDLTQLG
ncbi:MAG: hypothetical protein V4530_07400 [Pseudomonadota bacterium]